MGFFYLGLLIVYVLCSFVLIWLAKKIFKRRWLTTLTVVFVVLFPTYDMLLQSMLLKYYSSTRTLQQIKRTVEVPGSVYWEDNVWPGYDDKYRLWMIDHLLDGEHLASLAMNGPDGKIYLYRYGQGDTPEIFSRTSDLPPLNYHIVLNPIDLPWWQKKLLWADRMEIFDVRVGERIAFSERYMGYSPRMYVVKIIGGEPFEGSKHIGDKQVYLFDEKILFFYGNKARWQEMSRSSFSKFHVLNKTSTYFKKREKLKREGVSHDK